MADKLDELVSSVQNHIKEKQAELTALQTQARALQSAHADLRQEVDKVQANLSESRQAVADSGKELAKRRAQANRVADDIIAKAQEKSAQADKLMEDAHSRATKMVDAALEQARDMEEEVTAKKTELQATINQLNAAQSELAALKKQAVDWGQS